MLVQMNAATRMLFAAVVVLMLCCLSSMSAAEETGPAEAEEFIHHRLGLFPGYTYIPGGAETAEQDHGVWVFTLGIDYVYRFQEKWSVGVAADIEFGEYLVVDKELNRENAMVLCGLAIYEVLPRWAIYAGPGVEFESHKNLALIRIGTEYGFSLGADWILMPTVYMDIKQEFNSHALAVGIARWF